MRLRLRPIVGFATCLLLAAAVAGYVWMDRWQRQTIFSVELGESPWRRDPPANTEIFDLALGNGETLRSWYVPPPAPDAPVVLYLHGSRWSLEDSAFRVERWADMGYGVLAIDYRGFGASSPRLPSQSSVLQDAKLALQELARRQPLAQRRFVYGHSLGGAIAVALAGAADRPDFAGLILESTFTNIRQMIAASRWSHIPGLALLVTQPFDSLAAMKRIEQPILFLHGTQDRVVPHTMSDALFEAASGQGKALRQLVKIDGATHSGASRHPGYEEAVRNFMRQVNGGIPAVPKA